MMPKSVVTNGRKYVGEITLIASRKTNGIDSKIYTIILLLPVKDANSKRKVFLLNKVFSIDENTSIIFPPVLFNTVKDAVK